MPDVSQARSLRPQAFTILPAVEGDAEGILSVLRIVAAERVFSAIDRPWAIEQERIYLRSLSPREATHVAVVDSGAIIGFQNLDLWASIVNSMSHVGQIGTFLLPEWRRRGVGNALFKVTQAFARDAGYSKFVIQVRASNVSAQAFYRALGFRECGRFARQVRIDGHEDDEIMMEYFL
jgi:ribosomal protein S18 acetylase RimI-like enzyme